MDPATAYRARLEARKLAVEEARGAQGSLTFRDRPFIIFARLLHTATAPAGKRSGLRKSLLEHHVFRRVTQHAAHRKVFHQASRAVLNATKTKNSVAFKRSKDDLRRLWLEAGTRRSRGERRP